MFIEPYFITKKTIFYLLIGTRNIHIIKLKGYIAKIDHFMN